MSIENKKSHSAQNQTTAATPSASLGWLYALLAYSAWGFVPLYWKSFIGVPAIEVLCHRIIWSTVFLLTLLLVQNRQIEFRKTCQFGKPLVMLGFSALLLAMNWGIYIYAVNSDRVVESSLGYFINPLVNVSLGYLFLKERLKLSQRIAVLLAVIGVGYFIWQFGQVPWIALSLAFTFAFYGLCRKVVSVQPMVGLAVETLLIAPVAIAVVGHASLHSQSNFAENWVLSLLFMGCGIITSFPLLWFNNAAQRLKLSTLGFFQYLAPTFQLMLGVFLYHEPFTDTHAIAFGFIWMAILIYSGNSLIHSRCLSSLTGLCQQVGVKMRHLLIR